MTGSDFNHAGEGVSSQGNAGINLVATGTANVKLVVTGGNIKNNAAAGILVTGGDSTTVRTDIDAVDMRSSAPPVDRVARHGQWGRHQLRHQPRLFRSGRPVPRGHQRAARIHRDWPERRWRRKRAGFVPSGTGSFDVTATGNTIGLVGAPRSGNENFFGIAGDFRDSGGLSGLNISNNTVRNTALNGIFIQARDPSAMAGNINADVTLRNNTVGPISDDDDFPFGARPGPGRDACHRVESRNDSNLCLDIANNASDGLGGNQDYLVRQRDTSTFRLERLSASTNNVATVESFIAGQNPSPAGQTARATVATTYTAVVDGTCNSPASP